MHGTIDNTDLFTQYDAWLEKFEIRDHPVACICDRCKNGHEVFLLPSDIEEIKQQAIEEYKSKSL